MPAGTPWVYRADAPRAQTGKNFPQWEVRVQNLNMGGMVVGANGEGSPLEWVVPEVLSNEIG
jgi:hypothetical protein